VAALTAFNAKVLAFLRGLETAPPLPVQSGSDALRAEVGPPQQKE
jgi:hypothetical protein